MSNELTNKFNEVVTNTITTFFKQNPDYQEASSLFTTYNRFQIVYNTVGQKLWFGNTTDKFVLTNDSYLYFKRDYVDSSCIRKNILPDFAAWGLPAYLGFTRCPTYALNAEEFLNGINANLKVENTDVSTELLMNSSLLFQKVPRFYYGDVTDSGDNGYWLLPGAPGASVYFLQAPLKINFMGPAYFYMEIDGLNCIDETVPWNLSKYTTHTNNTNGIVNSSFAKIAVPTTPIAQWFDEETAPYKYFNPPAERIRKLNIKLRYHNGQSVEFGNFEYSFTLELNLLTPQQDRAYNIRTAYDLSQLQTFK
jgi:hypothetical protein